MNQTNTKKIRSVFRVGRKEYLTPHLIRVIFDLTDEQLGLLAEVSSGSNNKLFVPLKHNAEEVVVRTYTNRKIDLYNRELHIDFVVHGDSGPASAWAIKAEKGDQLEIGMKESKRKLVPQVDCYLLVGDTTALPVIAAILEELPATARAKVIIEIPAKEDELVLSSACSARIQWCYNQTPEQGSNLAEYVKKADFRADDQTSYIFIAAEYAIVKELRHYFREEKGRASQDLYACAYWRVGHAESELMNLNEPI
ncbi:siderophore-interacting protein [Sphingobacterium siyangense subsp. cladoniae]|uniref:siderophore-interacting protein n=1 Tax=Sphingobacterium siyangense TaxID=459529 RepID=UPI0031F8F764